MKTLKEFFRNPPYRIVKRAAVSTKRAILTRVIAVASTLLFCSLLSFFLIDANPIQFLICLFQGTFGNSIYLLKLAKNSAVLLCISLAVTPAFKMKFWNIGAEGQTHVGALAATAVVIYLGGKVNETCLLLLMFIAAVLAGAIWSGIPAIFKAKWNTNETLFTLMMNYVALGLVNYFVLIWSGGDTSIGELKFGHLPILFGNEYLFIIISALILAAIAYVYLRYTKHGYEISVVGESENTAKYVGIKVGKVLIRTLLISGALCGVAGFLIVGALDHSVSGDTVGGLGFTAIMASWLAKFNPIVMIGTSVFIAFLEQGASAIVTVFDTPLALPDIFIGIILFTIIGCEFLINYSIKRNQKQEKED